MNRFLPAKSVENIIVFSTSLSFLKLAIASIFLLYLKASLVYFTLGSYLTSICIKYNF